MVRLKKRWRFDALHAWFSVMWRDIAQASIVWVSWIKRTPSRAVNYIVSHYLSKQSERLSWSRGLIFECAVKVWRQLYHQFGYPLMIKEFNKLILKSCTVQQKLDDG